MGKRVSNFIIHTHQFLGTILSILFFMWFVTGIVLIFTGFPRKSKEKLFNDLPVLLIKDSICDINTGNLAHGTIALQKIGNKAVYKITKRGKKPWIYAVNSLTEIQEFTTEELIQILKLSYPSCETFKIEIGGLDQWIPWDRYENYLPLYKFHLNDADKTVVYLSKKTGETLQVTTRKTRIAAWFGAIPHWVYFKVIRINKTVWRAVIVPLCGFSLLMCLTGIIASILVIVKRFKQGKRGFKAISPYKKFNYKWHHILGLVFGLFTFAFILSGLLSVTGVSNKMNGESEKINYKRIWNGTNLPIQDYKLPVNIVLSDARLSGVKKIEWSRFANKPYYFVYAYHYRKPILIDASVADSLIVTGISLEQIKQELKSHFGDNYISEFTLLTSTDGYFKQGRHYQLPVYKVQFNNDSKTMAYINPITGKMVKVVYDSDQINRWLYRALHTFNFPFLLKHEWLRRLILIVLCLGGAGLSFTGIILSVKYTKCKLNRN